MKPVDPIDVELETLVQLFYPEPHQLGEFVAVKVDQVPQPQRSLLAHDHHMTVTVEQFHDSQVDVQVLEYQHAQHYYLRKILLTRQSDDQVVQFGIVRLDTRVLAPEVQADIESRQTPLGRVLINHDVLREVRLASLCQIEAGAELASYFSLPTGSTVYGRTALIFCDGAPAIELLEIVR